MINLKYLIAVLCSSLFFLSSCIEKKNEDRDYNKILYTPANSANFNVETLEDGNNTIINIFNPWQGAKDVKSQLLILRDSTDETDFKGQILNNGAKRIVCMSSTHIAMLDALGESDRIVGVSGLQYVSNPFIRENSDKIVDVGYEGNMDYEALAGCSPDLVLLFSINGASAMEGKLKELNIPFMYVGDYVEESPLGKAEWLVALGEVVGKREEAITKFKEISVRYENLRNMVEKETKDRPKVMVNAPFLDSWFMPSSESYVARMIKDAGGDYIYNKNTGSTSLPIDMEEALKLVGESDFWINIGTINSKNELMASFPLFSNSNCVKSGKIYNNNLITSPGGGNDCYESGVVNPDIVLRDMVKIFHPSLIDEEFTYYHRLK